MQSLFKNTIPETLTLKFPQLNNGDKGIVRKINNTNQLDWLPNKK